MSTRINHRQVQLARESRGYTQKEMTECIEGLNQGNLSKMEKGIIPINENMLSKIATFLNYPISFFYKECQPRELNSFFYRKCATASQKQINILEAKQEIIRMSLDELTDSIEIPEYDIPNIPISESLTASEIARRIRIYLSINSGPVNNLVTLLESHGVTIMFFNDAPEKFSGVTMCTSKGLPIIFVNNNHSNDKKRFTIAHELGHLVMHLRNNQRVYSQDNKELDTEADHFASEFLMPAEECKLDLMGLKYHELPSLKYYWKISKAAIAYKAKELNRISASQYKYIMMQLSQTGQRKKEKEIIEIDTPTILNQVIDLHRKELGYTDEELSELLGLSNSDINNLLIYTNKKTPMFKIIKS